MENHSDLEKTRIIDLLNRCWMTHDGMWFLNSFRTLGIEQANKLNQAAIRSLAPLEIAWIRKFLGRKAPIRDFQDFKDFFVPASKLVIPDFMGAAMDLSRENVIHWEFINCFAYRGMKRIGAVEGYECGVIYRVECWLEALGLDFKTAPRPKNCLMHLQGSCSGNIELVFPGPA